MTPNFILATPLLATSFVMEDMVELTLDDLCRACAAQPDIIIELVSEGVIDVTAMQPHQAPEHWHFTGLHLHRAKVAMRLHRDLGVNFAGAALALELMDELQALKAQLRVAAM
jgi:chaperone modulatory protein CbpM